MSIRTLEQIQADYTAVRAAWLRALEAESYSRSAGDASRSVSRAKAEELHRQMVALEAEYNRRSRGGIRIMGARPIDQ